MLETPVLSTRYCRYYYAHDLSTSLIHEHGFLYRSSDVDIASIFVGIGAGVSTVFEKLLGGTEGLRA
jgi:hypothetical protein